MTLQESFGGRAGDVILRAISPAALLTGLIAAVSTMGSFWLCVKLHVEGVAPVLTSLLAAGFLSRAAIDRYEERWRSGRPVYLIDVAPVALRYLLLYTLLLFPLLVIGWQPEIFETFMQSREARSSAALVLLIYFSVLVIVPPLLLIVAVTARDTLELFSVSHWRRCFSGQLSDLFLTYVLYFGGILVVVLLCFPFVVVFATFSIKTIAPTMMISTLFAVGAGVLLLGGLCGEFARHVEREAPSPVVLPAVTTQPTGEVPAAPLTNRKPPLLDAGKRVADANRDIATLEQLQQSHQPNPAVLHALAFAYADQGRRAEAVATAREGIPLALKSGGVILAAELFDTFRHDDDLGVPREQVVSFAEALRNGKRLPASARLYSLALESASDMRTMKGAMQTAQDLVAAGDAKSALDLYDLLLERCAGSPLLEFVRERRADAAKRVTPGPG